MFYYSLYSTNTPPVVLKTGCRHAKVMGVHEECIMKQFASACISVGGERIKVYYLRDEYISEITLLPAASNAHISAKRRNVQCETS